MQPSWEVPNNLDAPDAYLFLANRFYETISANLRKLHEVFGDRMYKPPPPGEEKEDWEQSDAVAESTEARPGSASSTVRDVDKEAVMYRGAKERGLDRFEVDPAALHDDGPVTVFILGAGASRDLGFPVCADFTSPDFFGVGRVPRWGPSARSVFDTLKARGISLEELLLELSETDPSTYLETLRFYEVAFLRCENVFMNVEGRLSWGEWMEMLDHYFVFLGMLYGFRNRGGRPVVMTFNHDLVIEYLLLYTGFNYGTLTSRMSCPRETFPGLPDFGHDFTLLKLHGSFNYSHCQACGAIWCIKDYVWDKGGLWGCHVCGVRRSENLYVPPLRRKDTAPLAEAWDDARRFLQRASEVIVMGYSLPAYDTNAVDLLRHVNPHANLVLVDKYAAHVASNYSFVRCKQRIMRSISFRDVFREVQQRGVFSTEHFLQF